MQIIIQGHGLELTPPLKEYANKKFSKLTQFYENIPKIEVLLDARNIENIERCHVAEVTVWAAGNKVLRATEAGQDMYAAIDLTFDEIKRQVRKHKEKHHRERRRQGEKAKEVMHTMAMADAESTTRVPSIVKVNSFANKPMRENEALDEFKISNQDFLMFRNADNGLVSIVCAKNKKNKVLSPKRLKSLTPEEAKKEVKKAKAPFLTFKNATTNETNVIYKRKSGNYGLVEPTI